MHPEAELIPEVTEIDDDLAALAGGSINGLGTGGMMTVAGRGYRPPRGADGVIAAGRA